MGRVPGRIARWAGLPLGLGLIQAGAQQTNVEQDRREFAGWIATAPLSPRRAVGLFPLGAGLTVGPTSAAIPLAGVPAGKLVARDGRVLLQHGAREVALIRGRPVKLGDWQLVAAGPPGRTVITVFGKTLLAGKPPAWFRYDPRAVHAVTLTPPAAPAGRRVLAPDGVEVEASQAGTITLELGGKSQTLSVLRLPGASEEETELEIYFRDASNGAGSYPAGRFVALQPAAGGRYVLDFNRARNPFCAYNTVYPCPMPWPGNAVGVAIRAGERYQGGGLTPPPG